MSLISEALKEARHEAARQEAIRQGSFYPRVPHHGPPGIRRRLWPLAVAAAILVLTVFGATWWWLRPSSPGPTDIPVAATETPVADASHRVSDDSQDASPVRAPLPVEPVVTTSVDSPASRAGAGTTAESPSISASAVSAEPTGSADSTMPVVSQAEPFATPEPVPPPTAPQGLPNSATQRQPTVEPPPRAAVASTIDPAPPPPSAGPLTFRREAYLQDGTRLSLGGIAWSPSRPVALINGRVIGIGEIAEGFTLQEVQRGYVYLKRLDQVVILTLE